MIVSICICTHNRLDDVRECLRALNPQMDPGAAEILVVDSASDPDTQAALADLVAGVAGARLLRLDEPGLSRARNAAVAAATGRWVAFLDDDTVPFADYLASLLAAIRGLPDQVAFFGGRLKPRWPDGVAPVGSRWSRMLSLRDDEGERDTELGLIYGANIVYRKDVLDRLEKPFDPELGRIGKVLLGGEEMKLHFQFSDMGYAPKFFGSIGVEHKVMPERLTMDWVRRRAFWEGITLVALFRKLGKPYPRGANPYWQALKILALTPKALFMDADKDAYIRIWSSIGVLRARLLGIS